LKRSATCKGLSRNRSFRLYLLGQTISALGDGFYLIAFVWLSLVISNGKGFTLGGIFSIYALGEIVSGLISGPIVDRFCKKNILIFVDLTRSLLLAILYMLVTLGIMKLPYLYICTFLFSILSPFFYRAEFAILPLIVSKEDLMKANSLLLGSKRLIRVVAPAVGGILIHLFGMDICFLVDTVSFMFSVLCISLMFLDRRNPAKHKITPTCLLKDLKSGSKIILNSPYLLTIAIYAACINFIGAPIFPLLPMVSQRISGGVSGYGILTSGISSGLITSSAAIMFLDKPLNKIHIMLYGIIICATAIIAIALGRTFHFIMIFCFVMGVGLNCANIPIQTMIQIAVPSKNIGVVSGFVYTIAQIAMPISMAFSGFLTQHLEIEAIFVGAGIIMFIGAAVGFSLPQFRNTTDTKIIKS
jgi:MFS family permease